MASDSGEETIPRIAYEKTVLSNGLELILHVDRKLPVVHVNHWFHVGSKNEKAGRTGFAHLFEHLMFEGSKHAPGGYFKYVELAGANLREGGVNGTTSYDRTNYFATTPSGNLEYLLWLESDRIATLPEALTKESFENQRDVVRNERRQMLENQPYGRWLSLINEHLYPAGHPYAWPVIGSHEDLEAATLEEVTDFFRMYYTPNNLSLVIAGDFDPAKAKKLVERYYGGIAPGPAIERRVRWVPELMEEKIVETLDRVPQARAHLIWPAPARFEEDEYRMDVVSSILSDGLSSRLKKQLVYDRRLCTDVYTFNMAHELSGLFVMVATIRPGSSLTDVEAEITDEMARLATSGPTQSELDRARTIWEYRFVSGFERLGGFGGKADRLNEANVYKGDPGHYSREYDCYMKMTTDQVREVAAQWLNTCSRLLLRFYPDTKKSVSLKPLDRSAPPALGTDTRFNTPTVQTGRLNNGLEVFVVERRELTKVSVSLDLKGGARFDPTDKSGATQLLLATLDKGTAKHTALAISEAFARLGTGISGSIYQESISLGTEALTRNLPGVLDLFAEVVLNPVFPESEFERERNRHLDNLSQREANPSALAGRVGPILIFGADHPYGLPVHGFPGTIRQVTRPDIVHCYDEYWGPGQAALVLTGDINLDEAMLFAETRFGDWTGEALPIAVATESQPYPAGIYVIDRPDAPQTVVSQLLPAPNRKTPDYYALRLLDSIWGGDFQSRLNRNLREEKGFTYGISSGLTLLSQSGYWRAQTSIQTDKTGETLRELELELRGLTGDRPVTETELSEAKINRVRGYAQQFETIRRIGAIVGGLWSSDLPLSDIREAVDRMEETTLDEVHAAATRYAIPDQAIYLLVGDASKIEAQLDTFGFGPAIRLDQEGKRQ